MKTFTKCLWMLLLSVLLSSPAQAQRIAAGAFHTLNIHPDGTLWSWGRNDYGQLGLGTTIQQNVPVQVGTATSWGLGVIINTVNLGMAPPPSALCPRKWARLLPGKV
jgi:hypothetical protein